MNFNTNLFLASTEDCIQLLKSRLMYQNFDLETDSYDYTNRTFNKSNVFLWFYGMIINHGFKFFCVGKLNHHQKKKN